MRASTSTLSKLSLHENGDNIFLRIMVKAHYVQRLRKSELKICKLALTQPFGLRIHIMIECITNLKFTDD